jgi:hypothetical protein
MLDVGPKHFVDIEVRTMLQGFQDGKYREIPAALATTPN